ncbi:MAG: hypothetical protein M1119_11175 [Firmicutes bacterium]|nr:hypothetical protein [Bacillota bacterium]
MLVTDGTLILSQTLDILLNYGHLEALPGDQEDANLLVAALSEAESISFF